MKKLLALTAALALATPINFAIPSAAAASNSNAAVAKYCQANAATFGLSQGNCVALLTAHTPPNANTVCHYLQFLDPVAFAATYPTFGACTSAINAIL
jgi:hypothetical protein